MYADEYKSLSLYVVRERESKEKINMQYTLCSARVLYYSYNTCSYYSN